MNEPIKVKIKLLDVRAVKPTYAHPGDAGLDFTAISQELDEYENLVYHTGVAVEIPAGYVGLVFPRSSCCKKDIILTNCVGVIDSGYRGEITAKFKALRFAFNPFKYLWVKMFGGDLDLYSLVNNAYKPGDRVFQLVIMPYPTVQLEISATLSDSCRGTKGYGSSDK